MSTIFKRRIYSVGDLTKIIKNLLEEEFPLVWVRGEVSNISRPSSGHIYFSLKDKDSLLSVVWFKSNHFLSSGLLPEKLYNGQEIICAGHISVYPVKGIYQLIAEHVEDVGVGNLYLEFEALKKKLASKGYFDELRKRPIPKNPKRVGVITAPTGAAIRDFLKIAREKGMPSHIRIYPSTVQGEEAESKIVKMLEEANKEGWAEVLAIIRGGGSFEDLFIFNSETIATAIYKSKIPVITGIGHEIDFTIADMVADFRCATPTQVAAFLWEDIKLYVQHLDELTLRLSKGIQKIISLRVETLTELITRLSRSSPLRRIELISQIIEDGFYNMSKGIKNILINYMNKLSLESNKLNKIFDKQLLIKEKELEIIKSKLMHIIKNKLLKSAHELELMHRNLEAYNPLMPMQRGYSIVRRDSTGEIVRLAKTLSPGERINIIFYDDSVNAIVEK
jgi:exodeoxyribonuclease VII large subunit